MSARRPLAGDDRLDDGDSRRVGLDHTGPAGWSEPCARPRPASPAAIATARNFYIALTVVALVLGGLSLLVPSTPSYDPWSWTAVGP